MVEPLWTAGVRAMKWFNWQYSLPKVTFSSLKVLGGVTKFGSPEKPTVMAFSLSQDYARLWLHFAQKYLGCGQWDFLIVDCSGDIDASKLEHARVIRFLNLYHGKKIDVFIRKVIRSDIFFQCDDDRFLVKNVEDELQYLQDQNTPVVSLRPRSWWKFAIDGKEYQPMGSYALLFKRKFFLEHNLIFQPPKGIQSQYKVFAPGVKHQPNYDTADYANEKLLLGGYNVEILSEKEYTVGFDGLGGRRPLFLKYGKIYLKQAFLEAKHFTGGSLNGAAIRSVYGHIKAERLYREIFQETPSFLLGFSEEELYEILEQNTQIEAHQKQELISYFESAETVYKKLLDSA
ncbi:MAG: hypothetical protein GY801_25390 [bacterium]|nr:hypothetical protein [bacterium]